MNIFEKKYANEQALFLAFKSLHKETSLTDQMLILNTIRPSRFGAKMSNIGAVQQIDRFFYRAENEAALQNLPTQTSKINIGGVTCRLYRRDTWKDHLSLRIILEKNIFPEEMANNRYLVKNNLPNIQKNINTYGYIYIFSSEINTDTYISLILGILSSKHQIPDYPFIKNYLTFFNKTNGYQIKEEYDNTLGNYINTLEKISIDHIKHIIREVLTLIFIFQSNEYLFVHGNLTLDRILVKGDPPLFKMSNFQYSSIFYNGIRFCNEDLMRLEVIYPTDGTTYQMDQPYKSCIPIHMSYDIYVFMVSLLSNPKIYDYFSENKAEFKDIYGALFDAESVLLGRVADHNRRLYDILQKEPNESIKKDLLTLTKEEFLLKNPSYVPGYSSYLITNIPSTYYLLKDNIFDIMKGLKLKINIDPFYLAFINSRPRDLDLVAEPPYKRYPLKYFLLSVDAYGGIPHLCQDECKPNRDDNVSYKEKPACHTNEFGTTTALGYRSYNWDYCYPGSDEYELSQYKIISKIMSYYPHGKFDQSKLNNDIGWTIFLMMVLDSKLLIPKIDCRDDFVMKGRLLTGETGSRSRQFVKIDLTNPYDKFHLQKQNTAIGNFVENFATGINNQYVLTICLSNFLKEILEALDKQAFSKVNAISVSRLLFSDISNQEIHNEKAAYEITNKLLLNNNTPNVTAMILDFKCDVNTPNAYDKFEILTKNGRTIRMKTYFEELIHESGGVMESYHIFLLEMFKNGRDFETLLYDFYPENEGYDSLLAVFIQIVYTLISFGKIGLVHNDLHTLNIHIEELDKESNFNYIITDPRGLGVVQIINIRTKFLVKIFDFDKCCTFKTPVQNLAFRVDPIIPAGTPPFFVNDPDLAVRYDFSYLCRFINYLITEGIRQIGINKGDFRSKGTAIVKFQELIMSTGNKTADNPGLIKYQDAEKNVVRMSKDPFQWLSELRLPHQITGIEIMNNIKDIVVEDDSMIYILPDANLSILSDEFDQNSSWKNKSIDQKINICSPIVRGEDIEQNLNTFGSVCKLDMRTIDIDWVRHGESCSNLDQGTYMDKNTHSGRALGYMPYEPLASDLTPALSVPNIVKNLTSPWKYEPNLSYIGMQQSISLGRNFFSKGFGYDAIVCSPLTRTIMTALLSCRLSPKVIYVVPYISEKQNVFSCIYSDYQNTAVSSVILKQRIAFVKDWLENNWIRYFDDIDVMTDLLDVRDAFKSNDPLHIEITKIIQCKPVIGKTSVGEFTNKYTQCASNIELIRRILDHFKKKNDLGNNFYQKWSSQMENFTEYVRGPPVDFSILDKYEQIYQRKLEASEPDAEKYNTRNPNIDLFYTEILPQLVDFRRGGTSGKVLAFCHGSLIREIWKLKDPNSFDAEKEKLKHMKNTEVTREVMAYDRSTFKTVFDPKPIRTTYENFEDLHVNVCAQQSIKGILNFDLAEPPETLVGTLKSAALAYAMPKTIPSERRSFDVNFYKENMYADSKTRSVINGLSFKHKYLKYKTKYLNLEKKLKNK